VANIKKVVDVKDINVVASDVKLGKDVKIYNYVNKIVRIQKSGDRIQNGKETC
jgi:ribosomal protein L16/L10AE